MEPQGASLLKPYVDAAAASADRAAGSEAAQANPLLLAPSSYYLIEGEPLTLYRAGLTRYREQSTYDFAAVSDDTVAWADDRKLVLDPGAVKGAGYIAAMRRNADTQENWRRPVRYVVSPASAAGRTIRHLAIGDSLTWRGWVSALKANLAARGATYVPIGTMHDIGGTFSEGRSSWSPQTYTYLRPGVNADGTPVIQPVVDKAAYLALPPGPFATGDRWNFNPFIRPATGGDPTGRVHNGQIFDVRFYLDRYGLADPHIVTIALGTNPILQGRPRAEIVGAIGEIVTAVREALPAAGIALCLNGLVEPAYWGGMAALIGDILSMYSGREAEGIAVLPWWQASDPKLGFDVNATGAPDSVGVFRAGTGDGIHPIDRGVAHRQWAGMVAAWALSRA